MGTSLIFSTLECKILAGSADKIQLCENIISFGPVTSKLLTKTNTNNINNNNNIITNKHNNTTIKKEEKNTKNIYKEEKRRVKEKTEY